MYKEQVMDLWKLCFKDTDEFIRLYFDHKYQHENTLVYLEQDNVVAALQMLPYTLTFCGEEIATSYISGASTHPAARSRGIMKGLLASALRVMNDRHIALSILQPQEPWLFDYYKRAGYTAAFYAYWEKNTVCNSGDTSQIVCLGRDEALNRIPMYYPYFDAHMKRFPCAVQHTEEDFKTILTDLYLSGGELLIAHDATGEMSGMAFAYAEEKAVRFAELLCDSDEDKRHLIEKVGFLHEKTTVLCKVFDNTPDCTPSGMLRIVNVATILARVAAAQPELNITLRVTDDILPDNNGLYELKASVCRKIEESEAHDHCCVNIEELAQMLVGNKPIPERCCGLSPQIARMSLMLE